MGFAKEQMMEDESRGFNTVGNKYVCSECVTDYALKAFVRANASETACSYCKSSSKRPIAVQIDLIIEKILDGIKFEWGDPNNEGLPWESAEGGWILFPGSPVSNTYEILQELEVTDSQKLLEDIDYSIHNDEWCQKDYFSLSPKDVLIYSWREFREKVMHKTRYLFMNERDTDIQNQSSEILSPQQMLRFIGDMVRKIGLVRAIPMGTKFLRARPRKLEIISAANLGPPPEKDAKDSNRMSPAGIPMFYGAFGEEIVIAETRDKKACCATIGTFCSLKEFRAVDLTDFPPVPSLFDTETRELRASIMFLRSFAKDLSRPIDKDGREHIEYVPTQIVTEYFRRLFLDSHGDHIRGIYYRSSHAPKRTGFGFTEDGLLWENNNACVLFFVNEDCCDLAEGGEYDNDKWLGLDIESVKTISFE